VTLTSLEALLLRRKNLVWLLPLVVVPMLALATFATIESDIRLSVSGVLTVCAIAGLFLFAKGWHAQSNRLQQLQEEQAELLQRMTSVENANQSKSQLIANVSHEIRTPLSAILGFVELMDDSSLPVEDRLAFSKIIRKNGEHLIRIVNDIMDLTSAENGKIEIIKTPSDFVQLVSSVVEMLKVMSEEKGLTLTAEFLADFPRYLLIDETRVQQVLVNLVNNAIKFTTSGSVNIYATCSPLDQKDHFNIEVVVRDTGHGIDPAKHEDLFSMFTRCNTAQSVHIEGSGIGLALSRRIARLMSGEVELLSSSPGQGSSFTFRFPAEAVGSRFNPLEVPSLNL
jgi:signal transduction histidine kinase